MKYYLALDSGGTKTAAILYGDGAERVAAAVCGSLRGNTTPGPLIEAHLNELADKLGLAGKRIASVGGTYERSVTERLRSVCDIENEQVSGELDMGLSAAGIFGDGLLALCGTGATLFGRINGVSVAAGGYGAAVADEGSGYWIGRRACLAAIRDSENRGERTSLTDAIPAKLGFGGRERLREAIFSIYADPGRSPTAAVARFTPAVVEQAALGDAVAAGILREAAELLFGQLSYLCDRYGVPESAPLTLSGSVWRGNPLLLSRFTELVRGKRGNAEIRYPKLEPVLGVPAKTIYAEKGSFTEEDAEKLASVYPEFAFDINKNNRTEV